MRQRKNVFVIGLDEHNRQTLEDMPDSEQYRFHGVLTYEEIYGPEISFARALEAAAHVIDSFDGSVDAIIGFWDFPVTAMVPLLRKRYGLAAAELRELVKCEHKYWSRLIQQRVIDEYPPFGLVDPESDQDPPEGLRYPMWVKPVKSFSSVLAFGVNDQGTFRAALGRISEGIGRLGEPFEEAMEHVDLPPEIAEVGGHLCLAEEAITGRQLTVEGYRYNGEVVCYGVVDSVCYDNSPSFLRFQYPSSVPYKVAERLYDISRGLVTEIGLEGSTFNIEYFWDPGTNAITLLEINPRHSQSHAELFADVDGRSNHEIMLRLALGLDPKAISNRNGKYQVAAKCYVRRFADGVVRRHPTPEEIRAIERIVGGATIDLIAHEGDVLSKARHRDSYSYHLASIYIGAVSEAELIEKFDAASAALHYEFDEIVANPQGVD